MKLLRLLLRWRSARNAAVEREAVQLMTFLGEGAYIEARTRARACRTKGDREGDRLWSQVAVTIAKRTGYQIGLKAADRYERDESPRERERARRLHEVATRTTAILSALPDIVRARDVETALHNVSAHVRNSLDLAPEDTRVAAAGAEVRRAAERMAADAQRSADLIKEGRYPPTLEAAGHAVERLREALARVQSMRGPL